MINKTTGIAKKDELITTGHAPGYRRFFFTLDVDFGNRKEEIEFSLSANDAAELFNKLYDTFECAYPNPIDKDDKNISEWKFNKIKELLGKA
ncbi:MAG: hypothetical protein ACNI3H_00580 [Halarcobacter ebronensis]|uniref:hypothetical protein n=1 Tax=Halarcobacter ebronensis TaxID=1462615 RepID=UPI003C72A59E